MERRAAVLVEEVAAGGGGGSNNNNTSNSSSSSGTTIFPMLIRGEPESYLTIYGKMVVSLISTHTFSDERIPETLLFDKIRLRWACIEFNRLVDRISVIVYAKAFITSSQKPSPEMFSALSALSFALVRDLRQELNMEEAIHNAFSGVSFSEDDCSNKKNNGRLGGGGIAAMMRKGLEKDDPVRKLM